MAATPPATAPTVDGDRYGARLTSNTINSTANAAIVTTKP